MISWLYTLKLDFYQGCNNRDFPFYPHNSFASQDWWIFGYHLTTNRSNSSRVDYTTSEQFTTFGICRQNEGKLRYTRWKRPTLTSASCEEDPRCRALARGATRSRVDPISWEQALRFLTKGFSGQISQVNLSDRLDYKKKHLQENTAVAGTARNKRGVLFQEENILEFCRQEVKICNIWSHAVKSLLYRKESRVLRWFLSCVSGSR